MNNYNPFSQQVADLENNIRNTKSRLQQVTSECTWYNNFNYAAKPQELATKLSAVELQKKLLSEIDSEIFIAADQNINIFARLIEAIDGDIAEFRAAIEAKKKREKATQPLAKLGWNPRHWFDEERRAHAKALREIRLEISNSEKDIVKLEKNKAVLNAKSPEERRTRPEPLDQKPDPAWRSQEHARAATDLIENQKLIISLHEKSKNTKTNIKQINSMRESIERDMRRYEITNYAQLNIERQNLGSFLLQREEELTKIKKKESDLNKQLYGLLDKKQELHDDLEKMESSISLAQGLVRKLEMANNSYERAMIHQECAQKFDGDHNPTRVIAKCCRAIPGIERQLEKIEQRIEIIVRRAARMIKYLIIDGNNLCYEEKRFIGLSAILPLTWELINHYEVTVVFDASIRRILGMDDASITSKFPQDVLVHVVASRQKADETILTHAETDDRYVISNDRFVEFPEKKAVIYDRLIKHEILQGKIFVHDLAIELSRAN